MISELPWGGFGERASSFLLALSLQSLTAMNVEWRFGRGWSDSELNARLNDLHAVDIGFPLTGPESQEGTNWRRYYSESIIAKENPGTPGKAFDIAWKAITEYQFSDPGIVMGHFRSGQPLLHRSMLLEIKVLGLRYLCGARVGAVRNHSDAEKTEFGFRYDTLKNHIEVGSEWFFLTKKHETGEIWFRISASWRPGHFPNWWSHVGFEFLGRRYQLAWHRLAYLRMREIANTDGAELVDVPRGEALVHTGPEIMNSDIWILNQPGAANRVIQAGGKEQWTEVEVDKSSPASGGKHA